MEKTRREQLDEILKYAAGRGIDIPADVLLQIAQRDTQKALELLTITPDMLPLYTLKLPGAVPPPKKEGLILSSTGWEAKPSAQPISRSITGGGWNAAKTDTLYVSLTGTNWVDLTDGGATALHSHSGGGSGSAVFQRVLADDLDLADGECLVVTQYLDFATYDITLDDDSTLEIL